MNSFAADDIQIIKEKISLIKCKHIFMFDGYFEENQKICFIGHYFKNKDLRSFIAQKFESIISNETKMNWCLDIAKGLVYLHMEEIFNLNMRIS